MLSIACELLRLHGTRERSELTVRGVVVMFTHVVRSGICAVVHIERGGYEVEDGCEKHGL